MIFIKYLNYVCNIEHLLFYLKIDQFFRILRHLVIACILSFVGVVVVNKQSR